MNRRGFLGSILASPIAVAANVPAVERVAPAIAAEGYEWVQMGWKSEAGRLRPFTSAMSVVYAKEQQPYSLYDFYRGVIIDGDRFTEVVNPRYPKPD